MKSILVPTDFSACATNAMDAAMQLAKKFEATVHLYSCLDLPWNWKTMTASQKEQHPVAMQNIYIAEVLIKDIKKKYSEVKIESALSGGNLIENINDYVKMFKIDFIVMGSHGVSGKNEFFIGSNTQRVVRSVHCPVLVIKEKIEKVDFKNVVYASGFNENEKESFLHFLDIIKPFNPEIHLVAIHSSSFFDAPYVLQKEAMEDFKNLAKSFKCQTHVFRDFSVDNGVRFFADKIGADLIVIANHLRHPIKRMFSGSNVEALVNHSDLPVLSIDYNKKNQEHENVENLVSRSAN